MDNLIFEVQQEITNSNPNYKYTDYCKQVELGYWCQIPEWIKQFHQTNPIKSCIDIGVAMGTLLLYTHKISGCSLFATELEKHLSDDVIKRYNIEYEVSNIELQPLQFSLNTYDVIIFTEIFEHLKYNPLFTMIKLHEILNDNGRIYFSTPNVDVWGKLDKYKTWQDMPVPQEYQDLFDGGHEYQYSLDEVHEILDLSGFEILQFDYSPLSSKNHFNMELKKR
jgi:2-polyprenyl-3-methyl-5-hydroxy-6-metoxy-1,4-benzoquinol methylase